MNLSSISNELVNRAIQSSQTITEALNKLLYNHLYENTNLAHLNGIRYFYLHLNGCTKPIGLIRDDEGDICLGEIVTNSYSEVVIENLDDLRQLNVLIDRVRHTSELEDNGTRYVKLLLNTLRLKHPGVHASIDTLTVDLVESRIKVELKDGVSLTHWINPSNNFLSNAMKVILSWVK